MTIQPELVETDLTVTDRLSKRLAIKKAIIDYLKTGKLVILSPEAQVENGNVILRAGKPERVPRHGSGELAIEAINLGIPQLSVGIWEDKTRIHIDIGQLFNVTNSESPEAAMELMANIARLMPEELRGPFR